MLKLVCVDGFFDAGMLLQALKAREETQDGSTDGKLSLSTKSQVGKKLRLSEY